MPVIGSTMAGGGGGGGSLVEGRTIGAGTVAAVTGGSGGGGGISLVFITKPCLVCTLYLSTIMSGFF